MASTPVIVQSPKVGLAQIANADASNKKALVTAGSSGSKVTAIRACSDEASTARVLQLILTRSATDYLLGSVSVPALSGTDGAAAVKDLLNTTDMPGLPVDNDGQRYLFLQSGDVLNVKSLTTVTSGKTVNVSAVYGDF